MFDDESTSEHWRAWVLLGGMRCARLLWGMCWRWAAATSLRLRRHSSRRFRLRVFACCVWKLRVALLLIGCASADKGVAWQQATTHWLVPLMMFNCVFCVCFVCVCFGFLATQPGAAPRTL